MPKWFQWVSQVDQKQIVRILRLVRVWKWRQRPWSVLWWMMIQMLRSQLPRMIQSHLTL
jgi:hypothetical protein